MNGIQDMNVFPKMLEIQAAAVSSREGAPVANSVSDPSLGLITLLNPVEGLGLTSRRGDPDPN